MADGPVGVCRVHGQGTHGPVAGEGRLRGTHKGLDAAPFTTPNWMVGNALSMVSLPTAARSIRECTLYHTSMGQMGRHMSLPGLAVNLTDRRFAFLQAMLKGAV